MIEVVNLFSGADGWGVGAAAIGLRGVAGVEVDARARAAADAAGFAHAPTDEGCVIGDVGGYADPAASFPGARGLIASPPCPTFSTAGSGRGRPLLAWMIEQVPRVLAGEEIPDPPTLEAERAEMDATQDEIDAEDAEQIPHPEKDAEDEERRASARRQADEDAVKSLLTLEPARWIASLRPEWVALEQVPPVLPVWQAMVAALRDLGYSAWAGLLSAERYGVPQTRLRAILVASRTRTVQPPVATHHAYRHGEPRPEATSDLFGGTLLPWVSMAEALWPTLAGCHASSPLSEPSTTATGTTGSGSTDAASTPTGTRGSGSTDRSPRGSSSTTSAASDGAATSSTCSSSRTGRTSDEGPGRPPATSSRRSAPEATSTTWSAEGDDAAHDASVTGRSRGGSAGSGSRPPSASDAPAGTPTTTRTRSSDGRGRTGDGGRASVAPASASDAATTSAVGEQPGCAPEVRPWSLPTHLDVRQEGAVPRRTSEPAATVTAAGTAKGRDVWRGGEEVEFVPNDLANAAIQGGDEPAPTITAGNDSAQRRWRLRSHNTVDGGPYNRRDDDEPAFALQGASSRWGWEPAGEKPRNAHGMTDEQARERRRARHEGWEERRPATTVAGDPPGHKRNADDPEGVYEGRAGENAMRVTVEQAAALQSFPPTFPFAGPRTARYLQVGNACPPLLSAHVLAAAAGLAPPDPQGREGMEWWWERMREIGG